MFVFHLDISHTYGIKVHFVLSVFVKTECTVIADGKLMAQCHLSFCSPISKREPLSLVASTLKFGSMACFVRYCTLG